MKQEIDANTSGAIDYGQLNQALAGSTATLWLAHGETYIRAEDIRIAADTTVFSDWMQHPDRTLATERIKEIRSVSDREERSWTLQHEKDPRVYAVITKDLGKRPAVIVLSDGTKIDAEAVRVGVDTTIYADPNTPVTKRISTAAIDSIGTINGAGGAIRGSLLGCMGGGLLGLGLGNALIPKDSESHASHDVGVGIVTLGGGVIGTVTGIIVGASKGYRTAYIFSK